MSEERDREERKPLTEDRNRDLHSSKEFSPCRHKCRSSHNCKNTTWLCSEKWEVTFQCKFVVLPRGKVLSFKALKGAKKNWPIASVIK